VRAAGADEKRARSLAATCTGCHGTDGFSVGAIPTLAGIDKECIIALMQAFRRGDRAATVMHQHARGYTEEQIEALASWFASRKLLGRQDASGKDPCRSPDADF
jgi:cytochrome c553